MVFLEAFEDSQIKLIGINLLFCFLFLFLGTMADARDVVIYAGVNRSSRTRPYL